MSSSYDSSSSSESMPETHAHIRCAPGVSLSADQLDLLAQAFIGVEVVFVKREFRSGYSGALVLLVSLGADRAPVVVKLAHPLDLEREYQAYQQFVRQISPQNISHLQGPPLLSADGQLGLIQYSFAGGESHQAATSLQDYYETNGGSASAAILNRIFRAYGRYWWANNRAHLYTLGEQYDRLLPVHLQVAITPSENEPEYRLESGKTGVLTLRKINVGQQIRLIKFQVTKVQAAGRKMTLVAPPPPNEASSSLRIRLELDDTLQPLLPYRPGDIVEQLDAIVVATRQTLLADAAVEVLPTFDPSQESFTVDVGPLPSGLVSIHPLNPLHNLSNLLDHVLETKASIIHGDLNLQNILVDSPTGFAWIIDFGETRRGPTLLDLQRLEVQVITKLMPSAMQETEIQPSAIVQLFGALHADPLPTAPQNSALQEPFQILVTIRRLARQYLIDDLDWDEYYLGLVVTLIGALKYDELDAFARKLALMAAAMARGLVGHRLHTGLQANLGPTPTSPATEGGASQTLASSAALPTALSSQGSAKASSRGRLIGIGSGVGVALVALFLGWRLLSGPTVPESPTDTLTTVATLTDASSTNSTVTVAAAAGATLAVVSSESVTDTTEGNLSAVAAQVVPSATVAVTMITVDITATAVNASTSDPASSVSRTITSTIESSGVDTGESVAIRSGEASSATVETAVTALATTKPLFTPTSAPAATVTVAPTQVVATVTLTPLAEATSSIDTNAIGSDPPVGSSAGESWVHPLDGATYLFIPAAEFEMGSEDGPADTQPVHTVNLSEYWIMRTEVTNEQYKLCVDAGACTSPANDFWDDGNYADHPVTEVTWQQADDYAKWVGGHLPTEAEWEMAARGSDGRLYPWGDELPDDTLLNYNFSVGEPVTVGSYPKGASVFGALDMAGNVEEWVADWYAPDYYATSPTQDPIGPEDGVFGILRGGSYFSNRPAVLATSREKALPDAHFSSVGFRVAISP